jgi:hypothetical protein
MRREVRVRFWVEAGTAGLTAFLLVGTLLWAQWIEVVFRLDPDGGSGAAERGVVAVLAAVSAASWLAARAEWRRSPIQAASP